MFANSLPCSAPVGRFRMRRCGASMQAFWRVLGLLWISLATLSAEQSGLFTYRVVGDTVEITGYPIEATGPVTIPAEIDGKPVVTIGFAAFERCAGMTALTISSGVTTLRGNAFYRCTGLTSLTIPSNVTTIERSAFGNCTGLTQVVLPEGMSTIGPGIFAGCASLTDVAIPSSVTRIRAYAFSGCRSLTSLAIPPGVTTIEQEAFFVCQSLTTMVLPAALTSLGQQAFSGCPRLTSVLFLGDAPGSTATDAFGSAPSTCTVYYFRGTERFTSPTWLGYASQAIDPATEHTAAWLMEHGWPPDTDMGLDVDVDGVSLFLAYALGLDPRLNQSASVPAPVLTETTVGLSFPAARSELNYRVETSVELGQWTIDGVDQRPSGPEGRTTATVPRDGSMRFLRLVITN